MIATSWLAPDSWKEKQEESIRAGIGSGMEWADYLSLVDRHRIPAVSWAALSRVPGLRIPESAERELRRRSDACRMQGLLHALVLTEILCCFNDAGIPLMVLKGPSLSLELYNDIGIRQSKDLDILVREQDVQRARACLAEMGWVLEGTYSVLKTYQTEFLLRYDYHVGYSNPRRGCFLELHWKCFWDAPGQAARRWDRGNPSLWRGHPIRAMHPNDMGTYLCNHGSRHLWFRAKWLGDVARMLCQQSVDWNAVLHHARANEEERPILLTLQLLKEAYGLYPPELPNISNHKLPSVLLEKAVCELAKPVEAHSLPLLKRVREVLFLIRLDHLLWPQRAWGQKLGEVAFLRRDFELLPLPRGFEWAYVPLRPLLWAWWEIQRRRS
jgi:hypothetical protein